MAISIYEDGRVSYMLEWFEPESSSFKTEQVTLSELKILSEGITKKLRKKIGFE